MTEGFLRKANLYYLWPHHFPKLNFWRENPSSIFIESFRLYSVPTIKYVFLVLKKSHYNSEIIWELKQNSRIERLWENLWIGTVSKLYCCEKWLQLGGLVYQSKFIPELANIFVSEFVKIIHIRILTWYRTFFAESFQHILNVGITLRGIWPMNKL